MISVLFMILVLQDRPVIRLDDSIIKGNIRKPSLVEVRGSSDLSKTLEEAALRNLAQLEKRLLKRTKATETEERAKN